MRKKKFLWLAAIFLFVEFSISLLVFSDTVVLPLKFADFHLRYFFFLLRLSNFIVLPFAFIGQPFYFDVVPVTIPCETVLQK